MANSVSSFLSNHLYSLPKLTTLFVQKEILGFMLLGIFEKLSHMTYNHGIYTNGYVIQADKNALKYMFLFELARGCFYFAKPNIASKIPLAIHFIVRSFAYGVIINLTTYQGDRLIGQQEPTRPIISYNDPRLCRGPYLDSLSRVVQVFKDFCNPPSHNIVNETIVKLCLLGGGIALSALTAPIYIVDRLFRVIRFYKLTDEQRLNPSKVSYDNLSLPNCEPCEPPRELKIHYDDHSYDLEGATEPYSWSGPRIGECISIKDRPLQGEDSIFGTILSVNLKCSEVCYLSKQSLEQLNESLISHQSSFGILGKVSEATQIISRALFLKNGYRAIKCEWEGETVWSFFDMDCLTVEAIEDQERVRLRRFRPSFSDLK